MVSDTTEVSAGEGKPAWIGRVRARPKVTIMLDQSLSSGAWLRLRWFLALKDSAAMGRARTLWKSQCGVAPSTLEKYGLRQRSTISFLRKAAHASPKRPHPDLISRKSCPSSSLKCAGCSRPKRSGRIWLLGYPGPNKLQDRILWARMNSRISRHRNSMPTRAPKSDEAAAESRTSG